MNSVGGPETVVPQIGLVTEQPVQLGVGDDVGVGVTAAVPVGVGVGLCTPACAQYLPPVFTMK